MRYTKYREKIHGELDFIFSTIFQAEGLHVRKEQVELSHQMLDALYENKIALCDAAVGVGKTYAYLAASIIYKKYERMWLGNYSMSMPKQSIVISTSSITLQEAVIGEYLPFLSSILLKYGLINEEIKAIVRKGKEHFVCDNRLELRIEVVRKKVKNEKQRKALLSLRQTCDMDGVKDLSNFDKRMVCVPKRCPTNCPSRDTCRYQRYLKEALSEEVSIQICNHNYLLADAVHREQGYRPLLKGYQILIIDEAHKLAETAQQMYSRSVGRMEFDEICSLLDKEHYTYESRKLKENFYRLMEVVPRQPGHTEQTRFEFSINQREKRNLTQCIRQAHRVSDMIRNSDARWLKAQLEETEELLEKFLMMDAGSILYIEYDQKGYPIFCSANRNVAGMLQKHLWSRQIPVILTSGTLMAGGSFKRTKQVCGLLKNYRVMECVAPSPFRYEENCLIYLPKRRNWEKETAVQIGEEIRKLVCSTFGHTMVLFTSYMLMGSVYQELKGKLPFPLLKVWRSSRSVITEFKQQKNCVLLAAGACWEGVDFPGDVVSSLIITRLPFPVPDPVRKAEQEHYESLYEYIRDIIVPDMQKKLRQGFGRAIRTERDTCVVSILDPRASVGGKYYQAVMEALPYCRMTEKLSDVEHFIRNRKGEDYYM